MIFLCLIAYILIILTLIKVNVYVALGFIFISSILMKAYLPTIKGYIGEKRVHKMLLKLGDDYKVFHDIYVTKADGKTSQIDHVVLSRYGIFVIETKNYSGWIFGNEQQKNWTQVIYKNKQRFYNPILQNKTHIRALKEYLGQENTYYSIITFSNEVTFKFKEEFLEAKVIKNSQLLKTIKNYDVVLLPEAQLINLQRKLETLKQANGENKKQLKKNHIEQVQSNSKPNYNKSTSRKLCSQCGKEMKLKKGKYGYFYGCLGYPTCRHTEKNV